MQTIDEKNTLIPHAKYLCIFRKYFLVFSDNLSAVWDKLFYFLKLMQQGRPNGQGYLAKVIYDNY